MDNEQNSSADTNPNLQDFDSATPLAHVIQVSGSIDVSTPPRSDGYQPLAVGLMVWAGIAGFPRDERFWYMASAARRLDMAHRLFETVRQEIDTYHPHGADIEHLFNIIGHAEMAVIATFRAMEMTNDAGKKMSVKLTVPASIQNMRETISELRHAFEHIDARALGEINNKRTIDKSKAHTVFTYDGGSLIKTRRLSYSKWSLGIDNDATNLLNEIRAYLRAAFIEMCDNHNTNKAITHRNSGAG
jgi:hypothetical protein